MTWEAGSSSNPGDSSLRAQRGNPVVHWIAALRSQ